MPPKKAKKAKKGGKKTSAVHIHVHEGEGFFSDLWDGVKKGFNFVKDNKLISTVGSLIPDARAQAAAQTASKLGLGKRQKAWVPVR
jgi:hypothetical protein